MLSLAIAGVLLFAVLPAIDGFPLLLLLALAVTYQPAGAFKAIPPYATAALAITVALPTVIGLQETYKADLAIFADGGASTLLGIALSLAVNRLMRSVGLAWQGVQLIPGRTATVAVAVQGAGRRPVPIAAR